MREMEGGGVVMGGREQIKQKKKKGGERSLPAFSLSSLLLYNPAATYSPTVTQYHRRGQV